MRNFNKTDFIVLGLGLLFAIIGAILISISGINKNNTEDSYKNLPKNFMTYFWIGLVCCIIGGISFIIFYIRTRIDLGRATITNTNIKGVQQITPGFNF